MMSRSFSKDREPDEKSGKRKVSWTGKPQYRSKVEQQRAEHRRGELSSEGVVPPRKGSVQDAARRSSLELAKAAEAPAPAKTEAEAPPPKKMSLRSYLSEIRGEEEMMIEEDDVLVHDANVGWQKRCFVFKASIARRPHPSVSFR